MEKIVYLIRNIDEINLEHVDAILLPLKGYSTREQNSYDVDEIIKIKNMTSKEIYVLMDGIFFEEELEEVQRIFNVLIKQVDKIFFADLAIFMYAKKNSCLDRIVLYSPTLVLSKEEIETYHSLGLNNVIISKECEYNGYKDILQNVKDVNLGMLALGYPQIYFSKRKMLTHYKTEFELDKINFGDEYYIKEKTRNMYHHIIEDSRGFYIFAGEVFFPNKYLREFRNLGMTYFIIDSTFLNDKNLVLPVYNFINGIEYNDKLQETTSTFMMFRELINNYEK